MFFVSSLKSETDLATYIWSESANDIAPNTAWTMSGSRTLLESGGLMMKAKAYTPVVQRYVWDLGWGLAGVVGS